MPNIASSQSPEGGRLIPDALTEAELAARLKLCRRQLYKWRVQGVIPSFKLGRAVRFRASEVIAALERHRAG